MNENNKITSPEEIVLGDDVTINGYPVRDLDEVTKSIVKKIVFKQLEVQELQKVAQNYNEEAQRKVEQMKALNDLVTEEIEKRKLENSSELSDVESDDMGYTVVSFDDTSVKEWKTEVSSSDDMGYTVVSHDTSDDVNYTDNQSNSTSQSSLEKEHSDSKSIRKKIQGETWDGKNLDRLADLATALLEKDVSTHQEEYKAVVGYFLSRFNDKNWDKNVQYDFLARNDLKFVGESELGPQDKALFTLLMHKVDKYDKELILKVKKEKESAINQAKQVIEQLVKEYDGEGSMVDNSHLSPYNLKWTGGKKISEQVDETLITSLDQLYKLQTLENS